MQDGPVPGHLLGDDDGSPPMGLASASDVVIEGVDDGIEARHAGNGRQERHDDNSPSESSGTSPGLGPPRRRLPLPPEDDLEPTSNPRHAGDGAVTLGPGQWQCGTCTLINEPDDRTCSACDTPRAGAQAPSPDASAVRPPDRVRSERLLDGGQRRILDEHGWVDVTAPSPRQFPRHPRGSGVRITTNNTFNFHGVAGTNNNGDNDQAGNAIPAATRIFNGLFNGAIVGSVMGGVPGLILGGIAGAAMGTVVDRTRARQREAGRAEADRVASMLATDMGGIQAGTVRVHRGDTHITALARNGEGASRVVRVRYDPSDPRFQALRGRRSDAENELLGLLIRMSYGNRRGGHNMDGVLLQPEESFEELLERFGIGTENRGASDEVIASYPVETIVNNDTAPPANNDTSEDVRSSSDGEKPSAKSPLDRQQSSLHGTCSICLEDNKVGDKVKTLSCRHVFHAACIDEWLGRNAVCPCCKADVAGYVGPTRGTEEAYLGCD